jgi:hypothetical protein
LKNQFLMRRIIFYTLCVSLIISACSKEQVAPGLVQSFQKYYGLNRSNEGIDVKQLSDGSYIVLGTVSTEAGGTAMYLVKANKFGNPEWAKQISGNDKETSSGLQILPNGNYLLAGNIVIGDSVKIILRKIDDLGNTLWTKQYAKLGKQRANNIQLTSKGGIIVAGNIDKNNYTSAMLLFTNIDGNNPEYLIYPQTTSNYDAKYVSELNNGRFIIAGSTDFKFSTHGLRDVFVCLVNTYSNSHSWSSSALFGGTGNDYGECIRTISDSIFVCVGTKTTSDSGTNVYATKFRLNNNDGFDVDWEKSLGTPGNDITTSFVLTDNELAISGSQLKSDGNSSVLFIKTDNLGN